MDPIEIWNAKKRRNSVKLKSIIKDIDIDIDIDVNNNDPIKRLEFNNKMRHKLTSAINIYGKITKIDINDLTFEDKQKYSNIKTLLWQFIINESRRQKSFDK